MSDFAAKPTDTTPTAGSLTAKSGRSITLAEYNQLMTDRTRPLTQDPIKRRTGGTNLKDSAP